MQPKLAVSGYRGIWGDTLTPVIAREYVQAFAAFVFKRGGTKIVVGRDARESGPELIEVVIATLLEAGLSVIDTGIIPTPSVIFLTKSEQASGGIVVTASHNPIAYNGLKFITSDGVFTTEKEVAEIESLRGVDLLRAVRPGQRIDGSKLFNKHMQAVLAHIDVAAIRARAFRVALDPINSVGCVTTPVMLEALGASFTMMNGEPTGQFGHAPEPTPENLASFADFVHASHVDIGIAQDPDGDRIVLCDETGTLVSEELGIALCIKAALLKQPGDIAINLSTTNTCEDVATLFGGTTYRSKVGEANVVEMLSLHNCVVGGEGSGGIIWPQVNSTRDSYVGIGLILDLMAATSKKISELVAELPHYTLVKEKFPRTAPVEETLQKIRAAFPTAVCTDIDGLRFDFSDRSWVHLRPSNTEPIIRLFAEAPSADRAQALIAKYKELLAAPLS